MIQSVKDLSLDGIEVGELIKHLEACVVQGSDWQRLQVQQIGVRWMPLGQDQMLERQGAVRLAADPPVIKKPSKLKMLEFGT